MDVIKKLNDLRLRQNMSVYRLAELSGINQSTLANTFSRGIVPSVNNLSVMCDALGTNMSQFFSEEDMCETLTDEEIQLLFYYRRLLKPTKNALRKFVKELSQQYSAI